MTRRREHKVFMLKNGVRCCNEDLTKLFGMCIPLYTFILIEHENELMEHFYVWRSTAR